MSNNNDNNNNGRKNLRRRSISSSSVLVQLYNNRKVATKVDNMLDEGQTYDYIVEFCKEHGITISKSSLTNYKQKREESIKTGVPLIQLLDRRTKDNVTYITDRGVDKLKGRAQEESEDGEDTNPSETLNRVENVYNDLEFLDEVIRKGMKGLQAFDVVDTPLAMKAIELRAKITNNQLSGLSIAGLRELKLRQQARESALMEVIMKYVEEDKHDALFEDMEVAEKQFYENLDLTEEDRRASQAFREAGIDL